MYLIFLIPCFIGGMWLWAFHSWVLGLLLIGLGFLVLFVGQGRKKQDIIIHELQKQAIQGKSTTRQGIPTADDLKQASYDKLVETVLQLGIKTDNYPSKNECIRLIIAHYEAAKGVVDDDLDEMTDLQVLEAAKLLKVEIEKEGGFRSLRDIKADIRIRRKELNES